MLSRPCRNVILLATALVASTVLSSALPASAQGDAAMKSEEQATYAVVTADDVYIRSGPADSYYPFGKLKKGDILKIVGEKYNWARVRTVGPAFKEFFGYIRYPQADSGRFQLAADGKTGRTLGRVDLLAPNLNTNYNPRDSWKRILLLEPDVLVRVMETNDSDREIVHKVALDPEAEGWLSVSFLTPASPEQVRVWKETVAGRAPAKPNASGEVAANPKPAGRAVEAPVHLPIDSPSQDELLQPDFVEAPAQAMKPQSVNDEAVDAENAAGATGAAAPVHSPNQPPAARDTPALPNVPAAHIENRPETKTFEEQLEDLKAAYERLREEPIESAEVMPLRNLYLKLAEDAAAQPRIARYATVRAEQLKLWSELQEQRMEVARVRKRLEMSSDEADAVRLALDMMGDYVGVGRLTASTIYDGRNLPRLYRLQDPHTSRTIAYLKVEAEQGFDLAGMLDQLIGIIGDKTYDEGLRLNIITPRRIDLLTPRPPAKPGGRLGG